MTTRALVCVVLCAITHAVVVHADESVAQPILHDGDRWVYRVIDGWKNETTETFEWQVTSAHPHSADLLQRVLSSSASERVGRLTTWTVELATWRFLGRGPVLKGTYTPLSFPLEVGKTWKHESLRRHSDGGEVTWTVTATVEAWETIQVPAGTFKALRVVHRGSWSRPERGYGPYASIGLLTEIYWYSPQAKRWVRYEYSDRGAHSQHLGASLWNRRIDELTELEVKH